MNGMLPSFRLKISLQATLLSGLVLLAMAWFALAAVQRIGLERLDRELQALGDTHLRRAQPPQHWERVYESLLAIYGNERQSHHILRAHGRPDGRTLFRSPDWPSDLAADSLGVPGLRDDPMPPTRNPPPSDLESPPPRRDEEPPDAWSPPTRRQPPPGPPPALRPERAPPQPLHPQPPRFATRAANGHHWRMAVTGNEDVALIIGADLAGFEAEIRQVRNAFLVAAPLALLLLAGSGWTLAGLALRPVRVIAGVAEGIGARELDRRVPVMVADREFQHLIDVINGMLARIERSFAQATRFSADAAHELKTPLTILQGQLEQAVQEAPPESREQQTYADLLEEVQRLKAIVRKLLLLARADAGQLRLNMERLDFSALAQAVADDLPELADGLRVEAAIQPGACVTGDADLLKQALQNLASNAAKFNDARAHVEISVQALDGRAVFAIANTGPGIPPGEQGQVFERFYRADKSRNRRVDGSGLGLSLAREIARAHGGELALARSDETGTTFVLTLPLAPHASAPACATTPSRPAACPPA